MNFSYHLVIHIEGVNQDYGTPNTSRVYNEHKEDFKDALIEDALESCANKVDDGAKEDAAHNTNAVAKEQAYLLKHGVGLRKLPYPLSLMNRKEKLAYFRYLIMYDKKQRLGINSDSNSIVTRDDA